MSDAGAGPPLETVELFEGEHIVERGTDEITWFLRQNDAWVHVSSWPEKEVERLDAGAGTVWESRLLLTVPRGTRLMRVESRPAPVDRSEPLEQLRRAATTLPRRTVRRYYRVARGGRLERDPAS